MINSKSLLFWGELPPTVFHGISLSNDRILSTLSADFEIYKVEDKTSFGGRGRALLSFFFSILKLIYLSSRKVDIYYTNMPMSFLGLWKVYLSLLVIKVLSPEAKVFTHLHRGDFLEFINVPRNKRLFKRFTSRVDTILVLSKSAVEELKDGASIEEHKIKILHNTVTVYSDKDDISIGKSDKRIRDFYCLCNYIPTKRIHHLVEISNQNPLIPIKFNGASSNDDYMDELKKLDVHSLCSFGGVIDGEDKERKLSHAKALILPSLNEGMPLVILESIAQGTPVICFDIGYISDYVGKDYPGLVKELSDEALKDKIQWVEELSEEKYQLFRNISFKVFWESYDPKNIAESTLTLFHQ